VHLLQIWLLPASAGIAPGYEEKPPPVVAPRTSRIDLIVGPDGGEGAVTIAQDARNHRVRLAPGQQLTHDLASDRHAWVQVARGAATVLGEALDTGDSFAVSAAERLAFGAEGGAELLLFDLA
jgi:redox-sensitive bicupin YhaK (pirin superfamily)